jgi:hypothetical protein
MGILEVAGQTCVPWEPESLEKNRYRGGKVTKSLNRLGRFLSTNALGDFSGDLGGAPEKQKGRLAPALRCYSIDALSRYGVSTLTTVGFVVTPV